MTLDGRRKKIPRLPFLVKIAAMCLFSVTLGQSLHDGYRKFTDVPDLLKGFGPLCIPHLLIMRAGPVEPVLA